MQDCSEPRSFPGYGGCTAKTDSLGYPGWLVTLAGASGKSMQARVIFKEVNWQEVRISRSGSTSGQELGLRREGMERIK